MFLNKVVIKIMHTKGGLLMIQVYRCLGPSGWSSTQCVSIHPVCVGSFRAGAIESRHCAPIVPQPWPHKLHCQPCATDAKSPSAPMTILDLMNFLVQSIIFCLSRVHTWYLSQISQMGYAEKNLSCRDISDFSTWCGGIRNFFTSVMWIYFRILHITFWNYSV